MRFGIFIPQGWRHDLVDIEPAKQWSVMSDLASYVDAGPWESLWVFDHFHTVPVPTDQATHEAWTLMSAFAATTSRVRLGQMCTCMSYRNPAYLAKVAATIDIISGGRVEMGIGAGWYEHEWRAYGYGFPRPGERLARLDEGGQRRLLHRVNSEPERPAPGRGDLRRSRFGLLRLQVADHHCGPFRGQQLRCREADPACTSGNHSDFTLDSIHG